MYKCLQCGYKFYEPEIDGFSYPVPFVDAVEEKLYEVCPECGSTEFRELYWGEENE